MSAFNTLKLLTSCTLLIFVRASQLLVLLKFHKRAMLMRFSRVLRLQSKESVMLIVIKNTVLIKRLKDGFKGHIAEITHEVGTKLHTTSEKMPLWVCSVSKWPCVYLSE